MVEKKQKSKRANKLVGVGDAVSKAIDPAFRKRGFASRDLIAQWGVIAPTPYDKVAMPDELKWPRREAGAEGATLILRCKQSHAMALAHEGPIIAAAVNRYFGYLLVGSVKMSRTPFSPHSAKVEDSAYVPAPEVRKNVDAAVSGIEDEGLREALRHLGHGLMKPK